MRPGFCALFVLLAILPSGCATNRSTLELYQRIQAIRLYGFACNAVARAKPDARLQQLRPWLESALGAAEVDSTEARFGQDEGTLDLVSCPDAEAVQQSRLEYLGILRELERRSRRGGGRTP